MAKFQAVYYRAADGSEPVDEFIDKLAVKRQVVLDNQIDRLNMLTPERPDFRSLTARRSRANYASCIATTVLSSTASSTGARAT